MSWLGTICPTVVFAALLYLPGLATLRSCGVPWRATPLTAAPVSAGIFGLLTLVSSGVPLWTANLGAGVLIASAVVLAIAELRKRNHAFSGLRHEPDALSVSAKASTRWGLMLVGGLAVNAAVVVVQFVRPFHGSDAIAQIYDTPFHFSVIKEILLTGNASSLNAGQIDGTSGAGFYPILWHSLVALTMELTGAQMAVAVNASVIVILGLVLPLGIVGSLVFSGRRFRSGDAFTGAALAGVVAAFPWSYLVFGVLYSNLMAMALLPAVVGAFVLLVEGWRRRLTRPTLPADGGAQEPDSRSGNGYMTNISLLVIVLLGLIGLGLAQPNTIFTAAVVLLPFLMAASFRAVRNYRGQIRSMRTSIAAPLGILVAFIVGWLWLYRLPQMQRTVTWRWDSFETIPQALGEVTLLGFNETPGQVLVAILVLVGLWTILRTRRGRWVVCSYGFLGAQYILAAGNEGALRDLLTGFWYHDSTRLAAAASLLAVPLAVIGVVSGTRLLAADLARANVPIFAQVRATGTGLAPRKRVFAVATVVLVLCVVVFELAGPSMASKRISMALESDSNSSHFLDDDERQFIQDIAGVVGDSVVANNPYDGSVFAFSLDGVNVLFKSFEGNWMGEATDAQRAIMSQLNEIGAEPDLVCGAVKELGVQYVLTLRNHPQTYYYPEQWRGLDVHSGTMGFRSVKTGDNMALYEVTGCE